MADNILEVLQTDDGFFAMCPVYATDDDAGGGGGGPQLADFTRVEVTVTQGPSSCLLRGTLGSTDFSVGGDPAYSLGAHAATAEALFKN